MQRQPVEERGSKKGLRAAQPISLLRVLRLPDIQSIEDKILIQAPRHGELPWELSDFIDDVSKRIFGITRNDTLFEYPADYADLEEESEAWWDIYDLREIHEQQFQTSNLPDEEAVQALLRLGLDFRDADGNPLRCTKFFCRQAEAAAKGIAGKMPDIRSVDAHSWESKLRKESEEFVRKRRPKR